MNQENSESTEFMTCDVLITLSEMAEAMEVSKFLLYVKYYIVILEVRCPHEILIFPMPSSLPSVIMSLNFPHYVTSVFS